MKAMILAAGRGSRLRPFTDRLPKPLVEIAGMPLIGHHLSRLAAIGIREIVINIAYEGQQIRSALGDGARYGVSIAYSEEEPGALDTGGGIAQAAPLLGDADFLLVNADVFTNFDFRRLMAEAPRAPLTLALIDNPPHHPAGDFGLADGRLTRTGPLFTYSGIGRFSPRLFAERIGQRFGLAEIIRHAIDEAPGDAQRDSGADGTPGGLYHDGLWIDVGRAATLARARQLLG